MTASQIQYLDGYAPLGSVLSWGARKVYALGDSLMARCLAPLSEYYGWNVNCYARPSDAVADQGNDCMSISPAQGDIMLHMLGTNDKISNTTDDPNRDMIFQKGLLAELLHLCTKESSNKIWAQSMSSTGSWLNMSTDNAYRGRYSTANGATLTCTVSGTTVALASWYFKDQTGSISVTIDGVGKGTFSCQTDGNNTTSYSTTGGPWAQLFMGLSSGSHTVVVTVTSAGGAPNYCYVCFVAGYSGTADSSDPKVYVANTHDFTAAANAAQGTSTARNTRYKTITSNIVNAVAGAGLNCTLIDIDAVIGDGDLDSGVAISGGGVHFNQSGCLKVRDAFVSAIGS